jgi:hypothetical protein
MAAGKVSSRGPVQITIIEEKPGALLLYWEEVPNKTDLTELFIKYVFSG